MTINLIPRVQPVERMPRSKHSTQDPNERRRRQLLLAYTATHAAATKAQSFDRVLRDTVEISAEGRAFLEKQSH